MNRRSIVIAWIGLLAIAATAIARVPVTADLTAFLPASANRAQQLLIDQLRDGVAARTILIAIEGEDARRAADVSRSLTSALREDERFRYVTNGSLELSLPDEQALFRFRYLLSPDITVERFAAAALRRALEADLALLGSSSSAWVSRNLQADPTGEVLAILRLLTPARTPEMREGVWFSPDGRRALGIAETRAPGFDPDGQASAIAAVRAAFASIPDASGLTLILAGPGVFTAQARQSIELDAWRLSAIATVGVVCLLLWVYRSPSLVLAGMLPVVSGLAVGIAAVAVTFGVVHGITLGFGATLIGEAVDYPTYLMVQRGREESVVAAARRIWPTLRLAVLTTVFSSLTMLLSSFRGLAQLGLLSLSGIFAAGVVTRWVVPALPLDRAGRAKRESMPASLDPSKLRGGGALTRGALALAVAAAAAYIVGQRADLWDDDIENLSPISAKAKALDEELRAGLHAPDVRYLLVVNAPGREEVLQAAEALRPALLELTAAKAISGFDLPSDYLPSERRQAERRAALPPAAALTEAIERAQAGLPFRKGVFEPFVKDVEATRRGLTLRSEDLQGTALGVKVRSLLVQQNRDWFAFIPLHDVADPAALARTAGAWAHDVARAEERGVARAGERGVARAEDRGVQFLDLKAEANRLIAGYRGQSLRLTALGFCAIAAVLLTGLRSPGATLRVLGPVVAATLLAVACLRLSGLRLTLFHLVALLLVIGVGVNYALFFNQPESDARSRRLTTLSLCVCCGTTLCAFGALATSSMPVLHALGVTVSVGIVFSFLLAAVFAPFHASNTEEHGRADRAI